MTTFVSLYQRFQEILAPEKKKVREKQRNLSLHSVLF